MCLPTARGGGREWEGREGEATSSMTTAGTRPEPGTQCQQQQQQQQEPEEQQKELKKWATKGRKKGQREAAKRGSQLQLLSQVESVRAEGE